MEKHIRILGWLFIVLNALFIVGAVVVAGAIALGGEIALQEELEYLPDIAATVVGIGLAVIAIPGIIVGVGLLAHKQWARIIALVLAAIQLFNVPIGTILAVYAFWVLLHPETVEAFHRGNGSGRHETRGDFRSGRHSDTAFQR
jgi:hypothetical protein